MAKKRVHITLSKSVLGNADLLQSVSEEIVTTAGMTNVNDRRLSRYGIISGEVSDEEIPIIRHNPNVDSVDSDEQRYAT